MSYGHRVFSSDTSFGLVPIGDKPVHVQLLAFGRDKTTISVEVEGDRQEHLLVYLGADEAMKLAGLLRKMAVAAFEDEAGA